ncbi:MAG: DNA-protecting protein DprA [Chloroflexota bacterium]
MSVAAPEGDALGWAVLGSVEELGPATALALVEACGGAAAVVARAAEDGGASLVPLLEARRRRGAVEPALLASRIGAAGRDAPALADRLVARGIAVGTLDDPGYPPRLRATADPPPVLFVRGDPAALAAPRAVAVVGTRRPTDMGRRVAGRLAGSLARAGAVVVSGLAVGIDGAAHAAAVAESAPTVAVIGGGHDRLFPRAHARLADAIVAEGGAVVAEVGPAVEPRRYSFPRRNRVISGLAEAVVVVEAAARSGALITAAQALEQGRGCYVVPGPLESERSAGCLRLLREFPGLVRVVAGYAELLEDLDLGREAPGPGAVGGAPAPRAVPADATPLGAVESAVAAALVDGAATLDELAARVEGSPATLLGAITLLEIRGLVVGAYGRYRPAGRLASGGIVPAGREGAPVRSRMLSSRRP